MLVLANHYYLLSLEIEAIDELPDKERTAAENEEKRYKLDGKRGLIREVLDSCIYSQFKEMILPEDAFFKKNKKGECALM